MSREWMEEKNGRKKEKKKEKKIIFFFRFLENGKVYDSAK